mgnify:CR=1 FL=1
MISIEVGEEEQAVEESVDELMQIMGKKDKN